jgi:hypothetical protein
MEVLADVTALERRQIERDLRKLARAVGRQAVLLEMALRDLEEARRGAR